jgi:hypothetical protein
MASDAATHHVGWGRNAHGEDVHSRFDTSDGLDFSWSECPGASQRESTIFLRGVDPRPNLLVKVFCRRHSFSVSLTSALYLQVLY